MSKNKKGNMRKIRVLLKEEAMYKKIAVTNQKGEVAKITKMSRQGITARHAILILSWMVCKNRLKLHRTSR